MITAEGIAERVRERLGAERVEVVDETAAHAGHEGTRGAASGTHFRCLVVASSFAGLGLVERHRAVYAAVEDWMRAPDGIHALALETLTPDEAAS